MDESTWAVENFGNAYRNWIRERMHARRYSILLDYLYDTEYRWDPDIPRDSDRESDGRDLRRRFSDETGMELPDGWYEHPASFLETMVALAFAIDDDIMYDPDNSEQVSEWFWMMMSNMGLDALDDATILSDPDRAYRMATDAVESEMDRRFDYNGYPGMFPLRKPMADQRKVETWYRANAYMMEEFFE